ncbi:1191_t:CDS:2 [Gigaspora margarita]|uniref:1191_t:CDS:1 n=1 Tax=Gigaspora margarita TaxID=4874 RepID=A0ABN7VGI2_GIGMA|nr:1191_t:CDS:2 [Gigaspora margarita]
MISLQNVLLKQFKNENISNFVANDTNMIDFLDVFNIVEVSDKDEELEQAEELADNTNITKPIKKMMPTSDIQDNLRHGFDQETSNDTCEPLSDGIMLNMSESFISSVFVSALPRVNRSNEVD